MDARPCLNCGAEAAEGYAVCPQCGQPIGEINRSTRLHPLAPAVFLVAATAVGAAVGLTAGLAVGIPASLLGGGIGVWVLERGRRLL